MKFDEHILKSKNILITGASKGIGRELSIGFSKYGANVILLGRNETNKLLTIRSDSVNLTCIKF